MDDPDVGTLEPTEEGLMVVEEDGEVVGKFDGNTVGTILSGTDGRDDLPVGEAVGIDVG